MMHITEDTPPDMLSGAMDLTVHLPTDKSIKMCVERSTPMMDLLVQITTSQHLQLSNYTLQALQMIPSPQYVERVLPYKPNTPIGALDTQHIRVVPKNKSISAPRAVPQGHQPFESTFRLKVHLPRNQLYVTRVSRSVYLEDIMKKVCEEKILDPLKYEFRHPANLDETLDPKLTLSDYQITEIYVVQRGTTSLHQTFSTNDILALRKEEERKQMHNKTGGGVFNLIFRRGKGSTGSGSMSTENSISPTQSDDSRSVSPPAVQPTFINPSENKPKPPQRKRRPAPKPPTENISKTSTVSDTSSGDMNTKIGDNTNNGLTICHSRNSSDSSGYHETSILSDQCNTSLGRRPKSTFINGDIGGSTSNLTKMSTHSKSTSSLINPSKKKKAAPPPPTPLKPSTSVSHLESPSPLDNASQTFPGTHDRELYRIAPKENLSPQYSSNNPIPAPRRKKPLPRPRSVLSYVPIEEEHEPLQKRNTIDSSYFATPIQETKDSTPCDNTVDIITPDKKRTKVIEAYEKQKKELVEIIAKEEEITNSPEEIANITTESEESVATEPTSLTAGMSTTEILSLVDYVQRDSLDDEYDKPQIIALIPKSNTTSTQSLDKNYTTDEEDEIADNITADLFNPSQKRFSTSSTSSEANVKELMPKRHSSASSLGTKAAPFHQLKRWGSIEELDNISSSSFSRANSLESSHWLLGEPSDTESNLSFTDKKTNTTNTDNNPNTTKEEEFTETRTDPEIIDTVDECNDYNDKEINESIKPHIYEPTPPVMPEPETNKSEPIKPHFYEPTPPPMPEFQANKSEPDCFIESTPEILEEPPVELKPPVQETLIQAIEPEKEPVDQDWQYQLPSPPKGFRDGSPVRYDLDDERATTVADSFVTSPELFEKSDVIKSNEIDDQITISDTMSVESEDARPPLNKLSLENLEKRKSLVYNRELSTSLKRNPDANEEPNLRNVSTNNTAPKNNGFLQTVNQFEKTLEELRRSSLNHNQRKSQRTSTLPNFQITTYDTTKKKINIFEDDTIHSNTSDPSKRHSMYSNLTNLQKTSYMATSMENIASLEPQRKISGGTTYSDDNNFKKPGEYTFYKPRNASRSESFKNKGWNPIKPVTRSKSQVALDKYNDERVAKLSSDAKSSSTLDVSGLQSLGVMRIIQNKLGTPTTSSEELDKISSHLNTNGPPAINMSTWKERPTMNVHVKEDPDYKLGIGTNNNKQTKVVVNTKNNIVNNNSTVRTTNTMPEPSEKNVSIKINGSEPITSQNSGNVLIKIGQSNGTSSNKFSGMEVFNTPMGYRQPFGALNKNARPHSIALPSDFDISRVPVVRSVELKKPFKDIQNNTSVTQINYGANPTETKSSNTADFAKPVLRTNSFAQSNRLSWNPNNYSTLPSKIITNPLAKSEHFGANKNVPFSQSTLRKTEPVFKRELEREDSINNNLVQAKNLINSSLNHGAAPPPPPPVLPKFTAPKVRQMGPTVDPRDELLNAIRSFGGKKGLRATRT